MSRSRIANIVFCVIWFVFVCVFINLAHEARQAEDTALSRMLFVPPSSPQMVFGGMNLNKTLDLIVTTNNENIALLEQSIRSSARTSFWVNAISAFLAFLGFAAQILQYQWKQDDKHWSKNSYAKPEERLEKHEMVSVPDAIKPPADE